MKKINNILKKDWAIIIIILLGFAVGAYFYRLLPERVPIHWNAKGQIDGYGNRFWGAFGLPLVNLGMYLLFLALPYIDPKKKNYDKFKSTYQYFKYIFTIFFFGFYIVTLLIAMNSINNKPLLIQIMISLIFILIGNVMGRLKNNYFMGIRTPWTLANDEVWKKTHRMAGPLWVIGGIFNIIMALININFSDIGFIIILIIIVAVPFVYSYIAYRNITSVK